MATRLKWMAAFVLGTIAVQCAGAARGGGITGIVSFGDSLSDVGNVYAASQGTQPAPTNEYYPGRFTNGGNWLDYLAKDLGVAAPTPSLLGGSDYAFGGASTGSGYTSTGGAQIPNVDTQISAYLAHNTPAAGQLFTIWAGANDLLIGKQTNPLIPAQNIANEVTTLAMAGAKQFLIPNLPLLGNIPALNQIPAQQAAANAWSAAFNAALKVDLAPLQSSLGIQIHTVDIQALTQNVIANPSQYGLTNVTSAAINPSLNGNGYLFWDQEHPTTQVDQIVAGIAAQTVPEPSSLWVFGTMIGGLVIWVRRRNGSAGSA
jgi:phospholipase/lecithinase/hemolysin